MEKFSHSNPVFDNPPESHKFAKVGSRFIDLRGSKIAILPSIFGNSCNFFTEYAILRGSKKSVVQKNRVTPQNRRNP